MSDTDSTPPAGPTVHDVNAALAFAADFLVANGGHPSAIDHIAAARGVLAEVAGEFAEPAGDEPAPTEADYAADFSADIPPAS
jgi:hypothetical protein